MTISKPKEPTDYIQELYKKVYNLEQMITSPDVMGSNVPDDLQVQTITIVSTGATLAGLAPPSGANLNVTSTAYFDEVYADANWDPPADVSQIAGYRVELQKDTTGLGGWDFPTSAIVQGTSYRFRNLEPNTPYRIRVFALSYVYIPTTTPLIATFTSSVDATLPPAVTGVVLARGATSAIVTFTPLTVAQAPDVALGNGVYTIELNTDPLFGGTPFRTTRTTAQVVQFGDIAAATTLYARVAAIDSSNNQGPWAASGSAVVGGVIESMIVGTLTGALITVGTLTGDRIVANSLDVSTLKTGTLSSQTITINGGSLVVGNPPVTGIVINSQGISSWAGGTQTFGIDGASGIALFSGFVVASSIYSANISGGTITGTTITGAVITGGKFRTAVSGRRIETSSPASIEGFQFFSGTATETMHGYVGLGGGDNGINITPPRLSGDGLANILVQGSGAYNIILTGSTTSANQMWANGYNTISGRRFKSDIRDFKPGENSLQALRPRRYMRIKDQLGEDQEPRAEIGLVAEEVAKIFPEAIVSPGDDSIKGIDMNAMFTFLLSHVQRLEKRLDEITRPT